MTSTTISILGCGWLGLPLAKKLKAQGYAVKGTTTSPEKIETLQSMGIEAFLLYLDDAAEKKLPDGIASFFECDVLIINIPPKVRSTSDTHHPAQIKQIVKAIKDHQIRDVIYVSATSVYPEVADEVDEQTFIDYENTGNRALYSAEQLLMDTVPNLTILRPGGLLGYDRIPGRYYVGKSVKNGDNPVNYIHLDDAIEIIASLLKKNLWGETLNLVSPIHPSRKQVFLKNASDLNFDPPTFEASGVSKPSKLVVGDKLIELLGYNFLYPDPREFYYTL